MKCCQVLYPFFYLKTLYKAKQHLRITYNSIVYNSDAVVLLSEKDKDEFLSNGIDIGDKILCGISNPNTFPVDKNVPIRKKENII